MEHKVQDFSLTNQLKNVQFAMVCAKLAREVKIFAHHVGNFNLTIL